VRSGLFVGAVLNVQGLPPVEEIMSAAGFSVTKQEERSVSDAPALLRTVSCVLDAVLDLESLSGDMKLDVTLTADTPEDKRPPEGAGAEEGDKEEVAPMEV
jgi:hypothetical protein